MPRIPTITRNVIQAPTVNVSAASAPYQAQAQVGQAVANLGNTVGNIYADIQTKRRETADLVNLATAQNSLEDFKSELAESLGNETDFNNISEDTIDAKINTFRDTYSKMFEDSPNAALKFDNILSSASRELKKVAYARHDTLLSDQAKVNTEKYLERETLNYVNATDPEQQKEILNNVNIYVNGMADSNAYSKTYAYDRAKKFQNDADKIIEENKKNSAELLKTAKEQAEKEAKEANQKAHDDEEREIGNLFMQGNYTEVYNRVLKSERLTGDEKKTWSEAIKSGLKTGDGDINSQDNANEIIKINDMIAKNEDPKKIQTEIKISTKLTKTDKEQYLNKLETKLTQEETDGRSLAYNHIKMMIDPNYGNEIIPKTSIIPERIRLAQNAFDDQLETAQKDGKRLSRNELRDLGESIAMQYQLTFEEKIAEDAKQQESAIEAYAIANLSIDDLTKKEKKSIEDALRKAGKPVTDANILAVYKNNYKE
jgi:hypothetical protein